MMTHGSLFSGVGGFEFGAEWAGIETLWNCEFEERKRRKLAKLFPNAYQFEDVRTMTNPPYVDIISGGFPCQDISLANVSNKKLVENGEIGIKGERSGLWSEMFRIVREVRPKYVIIENSPAIIIRGLEHILCDLATIGYICEWQRLSAEAFGFNHKRNRFFGVAYPCEIRRFHHSQVFREIPEVLPKRTSGQTAVSMPTKRFNGSSDYGSVRLDDGFSTEIDRGFIEDTGNAVIPLIAQYMFECIKIHNNKTITL